ncbi:hypothetical protein QE368_002534 [Asaia bogorensis NBRC 16594]|nr:hypothetical protein [Asaia bogorensis NBRC 16594]
MLVAPLACQSKSGRKVTPKEFAILRLFAEFYQRDTGQKPRFSGQKSIFFIKALQLSVSARSVEAFCHENKVFPHLPAGTGTRNHLLGVLQNERLNVMAIVESQSNPRAS